MSDDKGSAFVKGGCGCLLAFLAIGLVLVLLGGSMHIDLGGAILLFVIGGILGLVILAVYHKGQRDAVDRGVGFRGQRVPLQHPQRTDSGAVVRAEMPCPYCGARVNPATGEGLHSPVGQSWVLICNHCQNPIEPAR
jgi:hypothetical protein